MRVARGPGVRPVRRRFPRNTPLAEVVHLLVGTLVPFRLAPDGRLAGWYRLGTDTATLPPEQELDSIDEDAILTLHGVVNEERWITVEVEGRAELRCAVGTAVPLGTVADSLCARLDLPPGNWQIIVDGKALTPFHVLADRPGVERVLLRRE